MIYYIIDCFLWVLLYLIIMPFCAISCLWLFREFATGILELVLPQRWLK